MTTLQCARVDNYPRRRTPDANLPNVTEGSTMIACALCRTQVWISPIGRREVTAGRAEPVCDDCRPARSVVVSPE